MFLLLLLTLLLKEDQAIGITCVDVREKGAGAVFSSEDLLTLSALPPDDLRICTVLLGKEPLSTDQSFAIWNSFIQVYEGADNIPEDQLQQMGWIINGIPPSHYSNLSLTDIDTIATFGLCKELNAEQLEALRNAITNQWLGKEMEDFTSYDLSALRQVLCSFNSSSIKMIHPDAYKDAASDLATLTNCSPDIVKQLAEIATDDLAFGDPSSWTSVQTGNVGCIMAGLPSISEVPADAFEGITADIIDCMPPEAFQAMSNLQISRLSTSAANALSRKKSVNLNDEKMYALQLALKSEKEEKNVGSSIVLNIGQAFVSSLFIWIILI